MHEVELSQGYQFAEKTVVVIGAGCGYGAALARTLVTRGATVVALDSDEALILPLAHEAPDRIEPLTIALDSAGAIAKLGAIWADEPIYLLVMLQSLRMERRPGSAVKSMLLFARTFEPGLRAGGGSVVTLIRAADRDADPVRQSAEAAQMRLSSVLPDQLGAIGVRANTVRIAPSQIEPVLEASIEPVLYLGSDQAAHVHGSVLTVQPLTVDAGRAAG